MCSFMIPLTYSLHLPSAVSSIRSAPIQIIQLHLLSNNLLFTPSHPSPQFSHKSFHIEDVDSNMLQEQTVCYQTHQQFNQLFVCKC